MGRAPTRKKPCRVCRRWFLPDVRLKDRQMTCGRAKCKRQWHNKKCAHWYRTNIDYFKANYLQKKIDAAVDDASLPADIPKSKPFKVHTSRMKTGLPVVYVQDLVGIKPIIIIEYLAQQLYQRLWSGPP